MNTQSDKMLHVFLLPYMAHGHMIPMIEIAKLFASRNLKATIVTTPLNGPSVSRQIKTSLSLGFKIDVQFLDFPATQAGLPHGCEHADFLYEHKLGWDFYDNFNFATTLLRDPLEKLLQDARPDLLVADQFFPWATDSASKFGIPRLVFHGNGFFAMCSYVSVENHIYSNREKYLEIMSDPAKPFVIPGIPGEIKMTAKQLPKNTTSSSSGGPSETTKLFIALRKAELTSFGVIVNSFYELEPAYADHYTNVLGRRAWSVGPVSLCSQDVEEKAQRGNEASIDQHECLKWLNSKKPNSVVYVSFGSTVVFSAEQLKEIAMGLESSGHDFVWAVVRLNAVGEGDEWLPEGFKERMEGKGLIIQGWAPQVMILEHEAIGGFVTHCGWNSTLEAVAAGVPMVTWPIGFEQFYNEKLVTDVLKIGVPVGVEEWSGIGGGSIIKSEAVEKAVNQIMEGEEMRKKAKELGQMGKKAVDEGGSSYSNLDALIGEVIKLKDQNSV